MAEGQRIHERVVSTVDRRLVHKASVSEVFLTGVRTTASGWVVDAQLPREHRLFISGNRYQVTGLLEAHRQAAILISHVYLDVPGDAAFVMRDMGVTVVNPDLLRVAGRPFDFSIDVVADRGESWYRTVRWSVRYCVHGEVFAIGWASSRALPREDYSQLRRGASLREPTAGARLECSSSCVRWDNGRAMLHVNEGDPLHFDHPVDHVPGMALFAAAVEYASLTSVLDSVRSVHARFNSFVELNVDCALEVPDAGTDDVTINFVQSGRIASSVTVSSAPSGGGDVISTPASLGATGRVLIP